MHPRTMHLAPILLSTACIKVPTLAETGLSFSTQQAEAPSEQPCPSPATPDKAQELLMGRSLTVLAAAGDNPVSDEEWAGFKPGFGNAKNQVRHLLFEDSCYLRSPGKQADCKGSECFSMVDHGGRTWTELARIEAIDCMPESRYCNSTYVPVLHLAAITLTKCHELRFSGEAFILSGPSGEEAVMHATANGAPTADVDLPDGWTLEKKELPEPLTLRPFGTGDACFYTVLRDHTFQSYHVYKYPDGVWPQQ